MKRLEATRYALGALVLALLVAAASYGFSKSDAVERAALPAEARTTLTLIKAGGPFAYARDGSIFGNREGLLPKKERGYYREYTVDTPGSRDRGARRIVAGRAGELYFTDDHYRTFRRILE